MKYKTTFGFLLITLLALSTVCAQAAGSLCRFGTGAIATLDPKGLDKCVTLRSEGAAASSSPLVWELTPGMRFATQCPVQSIRLDDHPGTACSKFAASALHDGDSVRVDEWGDGKYQLVIQRQGRSVFHPSQAPVQLEPVEVMLDGKMRLIGYHADKVLITADSTRDPPLQVSYYVYLRTHVDAGRFSRWYTIEVFNEDAACRMEIPGTSEAATKIAVCPDPKRPVVKELPAGGGGEDPPG